MNSNSSSRRGSALALLTLAAVVCRAGEASAQVVGADLHGQGDANFGGKIANVGDADGDGVDDLLVAEAYYDTVTLTGAGRVSLYSGATMASIRTHVGTHDDQNLGFAIGGAGDVDLDGHADYVVGAPFTDYSGSNSVGMAVVYSGATGAVVWTRYGGSAQEEFGFSVAGIGDIDGDAKSDVLVGSVSTHSVTALDENGSVLYTIIASPGGYFGFTIAGCGDLDGDGIRDFAVGEPYAHTTTGHVTIYYTGRVHVYSAASGSELFSFSGTYPFDELGLALASLGDVDGDKVDDLLAGGCVSDHAAISAGMAVVVSGKTGAMLRTTYGVHPSDHFGWSVAGLGDMNHDGVDDYAVGSPGSHGSSNPYGKAQVFSGATGVLLWEWIGSAGSSTRNSFIGTAIAGGDFNQDGIADVLIGDQGFERWSGFSGVWVPVGGAFQYFGCPAWSANYGAGWPGKNGVPGLVALDPPVPGNLITLDLDNSLGATTVGVLFIGFTQANFTTGKGGTILVTPALTIVLSIPAAGLLTTGTLPDDPALYFFDIDLQAIEADPFASKGLSFTAGLQLRCGYDLP